MHLLSRTALLLALVVQMPEFALKAPPREGRPQDFIMLMYALHFYIFKWYIHESNLCFSAILAASITDFLRSLFYQDKHW